jgi:hypothetical protein
MRKYKGFVRKANNFAINTKIFQPAGQAGKPFKTTFNYWLLFLGKQSQIY